MINSAPWTPIHTHLHHILKKRQLLPIQQRILVALSGGQDSFCLLQLLVDLQPKWGWKLAIAHGDHRWPLDSDVNAHHVTQIARQYQLPYFLRQATTELRSEAAGRQWRYQILTDIAQQEGYPLVVSAHTASDRAETLLYNLMRGSGTNGLQALSWQRPLSDRVQLVRPLLEVTRAQTGKFCQQRNLPIWQDAMNQDLAYRRNRIRLEVLPHLKTHFNPQVETTLAHTAEILQAEVDFLEAETQKLLTIALPSTPPVLSATEHYWGYINRHALQSAPLALQRRALRHFLQQAIDVSANFQQIEKVMALVNAPNHSRTDPLKKQWVAEVIKPWIVIRSLS